MTDYPYKVENVSTGQLTSSPPSGFDKLPITRRFEIASRAIAECQDLSELMQWDDRAAALAAACEVGKMAPDIVEASRRVKNEALLRIGELLLGYSSERKFSGFASPMTSERWVTIKKLGLATAVARCAIRLASGGLAVRKKVLRAKTTNPNKLMALAPPTRPQTKGYGDVAKVIMHGLGDGSVNNKGLVRAAYFIHSVWELPVEGIKAKEAKHILSIITRMQEQLDSLAQRLEKIQ